MFILLLQVISSILQINKLYKIIYNMSHIFLYIICDYIYLYIYLYISRSYIWEKHATFGLLESGLFYLP